MGKDRKGGAFGEMETTGGERGERREGNGRERKEGGILPPRSFLNVGAYSPFHVSSILIHHRKW